MKYVRLILLISALLLLTGMYWENGTPADPHFSECELRGCALHPEGDGSDYITLEYTRLSTGENTELYISFDKPDEETRGDETGRYTFEAVCYESDAAQEMHGSPTGGFVYPDNGILINIREGDWLDNAVDCGSFTIEFWAKASRIREGDVVFSRVGSASGRHRGIEVFFHRRRLTWIFHNFFYQVPAYAGASLVTNIFPYTMIESGREVQRFQTNTMALLDAVSSFTLQTRHKVREREWHHYAVTFDHATGRLSLWIDGVEESVAYATQSRRALGSDATVLIPHFFEHEGSGALLGEGYLGQIEDFRISRTAYSPTAVRVYSRSGWVISPVHDTASYATPLVGFDYSSEVPADSSLVCQVRASDTVFDALDMVPVWVTMPPGGNVGIGGRYWQWRVRMNPSSDGRNTPTLSSVSLIFNENTAPEAPTGLRAEAGNRFVRLHWHANSESDVGGYRVYYSVQSDREAAELFRDVGNTTSVVVAPLVNGTEYYFWVSAYDTDNPPQVGALSPGVSAIPNP